MLNAQARRQFWRFGIAGGIGFLVDVGILYLILGLDVSYHLARIASFLCATFATWQINRNFAFTAGSGLSVWDEWWRYLVAVLGGGLVNYLLFILTMAMLPPTAFLPVISVAAGSIGGMAVNFVSTKMLVFRQ